MAKKHRPSPRRRVSALSVTQRGDDRVGLNVKLSDLEPPNTSFEADLIQVRRTRGTVRFICSQEGGAAIEARMALESFVAFLQTMEAESFAPSFWRWVDAHSNEEAEVLGGDRNREVKAASVVRVQIARVSHAGSDAEVSFYALHLGGVARSLKEPSAPAPNVTGVVKITCHTLVVAEAFKACRELRADVVADGGKE